MKLKAFLGKALVVAALAVGLVGCGSKVEVAPSTVGKILTKDGYKEGVIQTSKFRLEPCVAYCDTLVTMNAADKSVQEKLRVFMPQDKLLMDFNVEATLAVNPDRYEQVFSKVSPKVDGDGNYYIPLSTVYSTYAEKIIRAEMQEHLSQYTIAEVASSREAINAEIQKKFSSILEKRTPFLVKYIGIGDVSYPQVILDAQENAAERREKIEQENAQLLISEVRMSRELKEQQLQRQIDVERAQAEAEVNQIISQSMTPQYKMYRSLQIMDKLADSDNKVFMPVEMLTTMAGQMQLGK